MNRKEKEKERELFAEYYSSKQFLERLMLPPHTMFHHYRLEFFNGSFLRVKRTIRRKKELQSIVAASVPKNVYFTPTQWLDPSNIRRTKKEIRDYLLSSPLYFDIEGSVSDVYKTAKDRVSKLMAYIKEKYDRSPSWIIFSGRRGFHVYYWNWDDIPRKYHSAQDRIKLFIRSRKIILREIKKASIYVDEVVTADPWRLLRVPGTLHGKTGLSATFVKEIDAFLPEEAMVFSTDIYEKIFANVI